MTSDEKVRIELIEELGNVPCLAQRHIDVDVRMGMVSMIGNVESIDEQMAAYSAAARVVGMHRIACVVTVCHEGT